MYTFVMIVQDTHNYPQNQIRSKKKKKKKKKRKEIYENELKGNKLR